VTPRARFEAFRDRVDRAATLDERAFRALRAELAAERDAWLVRSCVVYLARQDRELATDAQLAELARSFGGKVATFIRGILIARRIRRDPTDAAARRDADAYGHAWLPARVAPRSG